jgi:hypothetical protein
MELHLAGVLRKKGFENMAEKSIRTKIAKTRTRRVRVVAN